MTRGDEWWSEGLRFTCRGCGGCCGREPGIVCFTDEELTAMSEAADLTVEQFLQVYVWHKYDGIRSLREKPNYDCVLLDSGAHKCTIYAARPIQCRTFPFWPEVVDTPESWKSFAASCPGMDIGELHDAEEIRSILEMQR